MINKCEGTNFDVDVDEYIDIDQHKVVFFQIKFRYQTKMITLSCLLQC